MPRPCYTANGSSNHAVRPPAPGPWPPTPKTMSTEKQIAANRRNAQLSTGPLSEAGKSRSSMNALQSGLHAQSLVIRGEDPAALSQLSAEYHAQFHPVTPLERDLVDTIVHDQWLLRRLRLVEAQMWALEFDYEDETFDPKNRFDQRHRRHPLAHIFESTIKRQAALRSRVNSLERSTHRALAALQNSASGADDRLSSSANPDVGQALSPANPAPVEQALSPANASGRPDVGQAVSPANPAPAGSMEPPANPQPCTQPAPVASPIPGPRPPAPPIGFVPPISSPAAATPHPLPRSVTFRTPQDLPL